MPRSSLHLAAALLALAGSAAAAPVQAQFARTGAATTSCTFGLCDANWGVSWFGLTGGVAAGTSGSLANAAILTAIPSPPWTPNVAGVQQWIGAAPGATLSPNTNQNQSNYRYFFTTTFTPGASSLAFGIGWDNRLVGAFLSAAPLTIGADGSYDFSGIRSVSALLNSSRVQTGGAGTALFDGKSGFCRDADGVFPGSNFPGNCVVDIDLADLPTTGDTRTLTFVIEGDGTTDGFLAGAPSAASVVPEPSTYAMMGVGLVGLVGAVRRRRAQG